MRIKRQTGSFVANDETGRPYTLLILTEFLEYRTSEGGSSIEGLRELALKSGEPVNRIKQGEYTIVTSGITLRSISEAAP
jgi:hypothetical protein